MTEAEIEGGSYVTLKELENFKNEIDEKFRDFKHECFQASTLQTMGGSMQRIFELYVNLEKRINENHQDISNKLENGSKTMAQLEKAIRERELVNGQTIGDVNEVKGEIKEKASKEDLESSKKNLEEKVDLILSNQNKIKEDINQQVKDTVDSTVNAKMNKFLYALITTCIAIIGIIVGFAKGLIP